MTLSVGELDEAQDVQMDIALSDTTPFISQPYSMIPAEQQSLQDMIDELLANCLPSFIGS